MAEAGLHQTDIFGFMRRLAKGTLPIVIACAILSIVGMKPRAPSGLVLAAFVASGLVLWLGWSYIRRNIVTKWLGLILVLYLGLVLGLSVLGVVLGISLLLFPIFCVALPLVIYDLVFRAPIKGGPAPEGADRGPVTY
jgi:hypothetical protein